MNIRDFDETRIAHQPPASAVRPSYVAPKNRASAGVRSNPSHDEADTSTLSRMMAQSKVDLNLELSVRPERVESLRKFVELPADFPDAVIDKLMDRLP